MTNRDSDLSYLGKIMQIRYDKVAKEFFLTIFEQDTIILKAQTSKELSKYCERYRANVVRFDYDLGLDPR